MGSWKDFYNVLNTSTLGGEYFSSFFNIFYIIAFLAVTIIMIYEGIKRKIPLISWLVVLTFSRLFFIIGTKVNSYDSSDWIFFFQNFTLPDAEGKVLLGGVVLGLITFLLGIKIFKIPFSNIDSFAFAFPVGLALQRFGCLLLGCCYGIPTSLPWGVKYGFDSPAHAHYFNLEVLDGISSPTPSLHPFQLYEILNGVLVILILLYLRKKLKSSGGLFLASLSSWAFIRFFTEFFRDPNAHAMGGTIIFGLKSMQWILLVIVIITTLIVLYRERRVVDSRILENIQIPSFLTVSIFLGTTVLLTWSLRYWMNFAEMLAMNLMLFPAILISV
uniref:prolipoprotein diacylglyceryl transferase family protein n=1 Tax=Algoriphagus sp. TaxID=1872435 RepID=UPI0025E5F48C